MPLGEIFKTANDRLKSPFLSSFIFSWIAFNWKAIFVAIAGDENVYTRIDCIESDYIDCYSAFLYPLLVALFYTLAFPFITVFFQWFTEKARVLSIEAKSERELLAAEKEFKIEQAKAGTNELKELNDQIEKLNEDLKKETSKGKLLNEKISDFKKNQTQLEKDLKKSQQQLSTNNKNFANWLEIDNVGNSTLKDFYSVISDNQYDTFKRIISSVNNTTYTTMELAKEEKELIDKGFFENLEPSKSPEGNYATLNLTEKGIKLKEVSEYYENYIINTNTLRQNKKKLL